MRAMFVLSVDLIVSQALTPHSPFLTTTTFFEVTSPDDRKACTAAMVLWKMLVDIRIHPIRGVASTFLFERWLLAAIPGTGTLT